MAVNAAALRCESDLSLYNKLLEDITVKRVNEQLARMEESSSERSSIRRHLLATSVRMSETMAPDLHAIARECSDRLDLGIDLRVENHRERVQSKLLDRAFQMDLLAIKREAFGSCGIRWRWRGLLPISTA